MRDFEENDEKIDRQIQQLTQKLRDERRKANISQIDLSFMANLSQNQVNAIETGKRIPNLHTVLKICNALNINPATLFDATDDKRKKAKDTILALINENM